jgi:branched-chain amino acid transport system permease protein
VVALNAVGFTLAYGVARQINLAHGNVFALTSVAVAYLALALAVPADAPIGLRLGALALLAAGGAVVGAGLNGAVERLAFRPFLARGDRLGPLVASVGLAFVLFQAAIWWFEVANAPPTGIVGHVGVVLPLLAVPDLVPSVELLGGAVSLTLKDVSVLLLAAAVVVGLDRALTRSRLGRMLRATAQDAELATLAGVDRARAQSLAFVLAGALSGFGAAIYAAYYGGAYAQHGLRAGLAAMAAAILGGVGSPRGALAAGMLIGIFSAFADYLLDAKWTPVLVLLLLVGLLAVRPRGLAGGAGGDGQPPGAANPAPTEPTPVGRGPGWARRLAPGPVGLLAAAGLAYPLLDAALGWHRLPSAAAALLLVALALGLNVVVGQAGLLDLGYAAFFAIGGYAAAIVTSSGSRLGLALPEALRDPWVGLLVAGGAAGLLGLLFGVPSVRARGEDLAIVTLALGEIVPAVIWHLPDWTGGARGMSGVLAPSLGFWPASAPPNAYALGLLLALAALVATGRLATGRVGRAWRAVRDDETAAGAAGVRPDRTRLSAFVVGATIAGLAGALHAGQFGYVEPGQFDLTVSLTVLAAVVIGARRGIPGVVVGALAVALYERLLVDLATGALGRLGGALGWPALAAADLRGQGYALFGVALYLAAVLPARAPGRGLSGPCPARPRARR